MDRRRRRRPSGPPGCRAITVSSSEPPELTELIERLAANCRKLCRDCKWNCVHASPPWLARRVVKRHYPIKTPGLAQNSLDKRVRMDVIIFTGLVAYGGLTRPRPRAQARNSSPARHAQPGAGVGHPIHGFTATTSSIPTIWCRSSTRCCAVHVDKVLSASWPAPSAIRALVLSGRPPISSMASSVVAEQARATRRAQAHWRSDSASSRTSGASWGGLPAVGRRSAEPLPRSSSTRTIQRRLRPQKKLR